MNVHGGIDFLSPPGRNVDKNYDILLPPALTGTIPQTQRARLPRRPADSFAQGDAITATAFNFEAAHQHQGGQDLCFDDDTLRASGQIKAVIICTSRIQDMDRKEHHVLLVSGGNLTTMPPMYE